MTISEMLDKLAAERGRNALIAVLWTLVLLSIIAASVPWEARTSARIAGIWLTTRVCAQLLMRHPTGDP
jgi:hypothetical protein